MDASHATKLLIVVLAIVGPLVLLGLLVSLIVVLTRRATREATVVPAQFAAAARALGAQSGDGYLFRLTRGAVTSVLRLRPRTRNSPCMLSVEVPLARGDSGGAARSGAAYRAYSAGALEVDTVEPLVLRLESGTDRVGKLLLVNREVQTGVMGFDERVYIETEAEDRIVQTVLSDPAVREPVRELVEAGWTRVTLYRLGGHVLAERISPEDAHLEAAWLAQSLERLERVSRALPALVPRRFGKRMSRAGIVTACAGAGVVVGIVAAVLGAGTYSPIDDSAVAWSALIGLLVWLLSAPLLGLVLRGRSDSLRRLVIVLVLCAIAFPTGSVGALLGINGLADSEGSIDRTQRVVDVWLHSGKSTSYYVRFESWRRGDKSLSLSISRSLYDDLRAMDPTQRFVTITVHPGRLGWEWYSRIARGAPPQR